MGHTVSAVCGNAVGEGKPNLARQYAFSTLKIISGFASVLILAIYLFHSHISRFYTNDSEVVNLMDSIFPYLLMMIFFD